MARQFVIGVRRPNTSESYRSSTPAPGEYDVISSEKATRPATQTLGQRTAKRDDYIKQCLGKGMCAYALETPGPGKYYRPPANEGPACSFGTRTETLSSVKLNPSPLDYDITPSSRLTLRTPPCVAKTKAARDDYLIRFQGRGLEVPTQNKADAGFINSNMTSTMIDPRYRAPSYTFGKASRTPESSNDEGQVLEEVRRRRIHTKPLAWLKSYEKTETEQRELPIDRAITPSQQSFSFAKSDKHTLQPVGSSCDKLYNITNDTIGDNAKRRGIPFSKAPKMTTVKVCNKTTCKKDTQTIPPGAITLDILNSLDPDGILDPIPQLYDAPKMYIN